jgi:hypothetical protein
VIPLAIAWIGDVVPYENHVVGTLHLRQILGFVFGQAAGGGLAN